MPALFAVAGSAPPSHFKITLIRRIGQLRLHAPVLKIGDWAWVDAVGEDMRGGTFGFSECLPRQNKFSRKSVALIQPRLHLCLVRNLDCRLALGAGWLFALSRISEQLPCRRDQPRSALRA